MQRDSKAIEAQSGWFVAETVQWILRQAVRTASHAAARLQYSL